MDKNDIRYSSQSIVEGAVRFCEIVLFEKMPNLRLVHLSLLCFRNVYIRKIAEMIEPERMNKRKKEESIVLRKLFKSIEKMCFL